MPTDRSVKITNRNEFLSIVTEPQDIFPSCKHLVIRFTSAWCHPCKKIEPIVNSYVDVFRTDVCYIEIDIDESSDIYSFLKTKRIISGIPTIFCYSYPRSEIAYIPDKSFSGTNIGNLSTFLSPYC